MMRQPPITVLTGVLLLRLYVLCVLKDKQSLTCAPPLTVELCLVGNISVKSASFMMMWTRDNSTVMAVVFAGLVDVTNSPTVTPVGCVSLLINPTNVFRTLPTTTALSAR